MGGYGALYTAVLEGADDEESKDRDGCNGFPFVLLGRGRKVWKLDVSEPSHNHGVGAHSCAPIAKLTLKLRQWWESARLEDYKKCYFPAEMFYEGLNATSGIFGSKCISLRA